MESLLQPPVDWLPEVGDAIDEIVERGPPPLTELTPARHVNRSVVGD